jgi:universal stress protein A
MEPTGPARILVPTDFSECAQPALDYACTLARAFGARLSVLHVVPPTRPWTREARLDVRLVGAPTSHDKDMVRDLDASARLECLLLPLIGRVPLVCGFIRHGLADDQIVAFAEQDHSDLIVVGSHGQTAAAVPLGRVAGHVLQRAACPVLTIPSWTRHLHHVGVLWSVQSTSAYAS